MTFEILCGNMNHVVDSENRTTMSLLRADGEPVFPHKFKCRALLRFN